MGLQPVYFEASVTTSHALRTRDAQGHLEPARVVLPELKELIPNAMQRRRMGRMMRCALANALECIKQTGRPDAIITATGLGFIEATGAFADSYLNQQEQLVSPTPFIQSTFNMLGGQLALLLGHHGPDYTLVEGFQSVPNALQMAQVLLQDQALERVLVVFYDELTPQVERILPTYGIGADYGLGEGSGAFMLVSCPKDEASIALQEVLFGQCEQESGQAWPQSPIGYSCYRDVRVLEATGEFFTSNGYLVSAALRAKQRGVAIGTHGQGYYSYILLG